MSRNITSKGGSINSIYPCTGYITFGPWIYMTPQYKPESVLMLGYAGGTTAGLIKMFYGDDIPITAVDVEFIEDPYNVNFILADARDYIKTSDFFDCIIVDVFEGDDLDPAPFITTPEFVEDITKKCNYLIIHATINVDMSNYDHLYKVKTLKLNDSLFYYYMINPVNRLPVR